MPEIKISFNILFIHIIYEKRKNFCKPKILIYEDFFYKNGIIVAKNRNPTYNERLFSRFGTRIVGRRESIYDTK